MTSELIFAMACLVLLTAAASAGTLQSSAPFIYVIDYGDKWIKDPSAAEVFGDTPPDVLHIGKAVPVTHNWGPIPYMAGENQSTGGPGHTLDRDAIRLLTPEELEQKIKDITAAVRRLHDAGIKTVMPYICHYSIAGDHESREGLWGFYDRWDDYAPWMGPKPPEGPSNWVTKDASGKRIETGYGLTPPYFAPLHRYAVCPNNPSWNQFSAAIVRLIARCGYDGVFVDNSNLGGDGCPYCQEAFPKWVRENFDEATLRLACEAEDVGEIALDNPKLSGIRARWHVAVVRDRLAMLRKTGAEIERGFRTFPNVGHYQKVLPYGDGCDLFMFESVKLPGCLVEGEPPAHPEALVSVAADAELTVGRTRYEAIHANVFSEVAAEVTYPRTCPADRPAEITVNVLTVGASDQDADCLEDMTARLTHLETRVSQQVPLGPLPGVGDPNQVPGAERPPVELKGTWTPTQAGSYAIDLSYRYTDAEHLDVANHTPVSDRLGLANPYRVNLGGLACIFNSRCKTVGLSYEHGAEGWEAVQELGIAEGAASGGRHSVNSKGSAHEKYWRFSHTHGRVAAGLSPYGPVTLLYAYWGGNPGEIGRDTTRTVQEYLSAEHVLYRGLVDRDLEAADLSPTEEQALVMVCRHYDMTEGQISLLQQFLANGGRLVLEHPDTRVNFAPIGEVLGDQSNKATIWSWDDPPRLALSLCDSTGRLRGVRFTAFVDPAPAPKRMVLHAVNYNVSLIEADPGVVTPMGDLRLQVPVPSDWEGVQATAYDPDADAPVAVECTVQAGTARLTLPTLRIYQMIELATE